MKDNIKPVLTVALLLFAAVTLAVQVAKEFRTSETLKFPDGLNVVCTHATMRCPSCLTIARLTREVLESDYPEMLQSGKIVFHELNYEQAAANDISDTYRIATAGVLLLRIQDGETIAHANLINQSWKLYTDEPAFKAMLREQLEAMLQGRTIVDDDPSQEFIFDEDEEFTLQL